MNFWYFKQVRRFFHTFRAYDEARNLEWTPKYIRYCMTKQGPVYMEVG